MIQILIFIAKIINTLLQIQQYKRAILMNFKYFEKKVDRLKRQLKERIERKAIKNKKSTR